MYPRSVYRGSEKHPNLAVAHSLGEAGGWASERGCARAAVIAGSVSNPRPPAPADLRKRRLDHGEPAIIPFFPCPPGDERNPAKRPRDAGRILHAARARHSPFRLLLALVGGRARRAEDTEELKCPPRPVPQAVWCARRQEDAGTARERDALSRCIQRALSIQHMNDLLIGVHVLRRPALLDESHELCHSPTSHRWVYEQLEVPALARGEAFPLGGTNGHAADGCADRHRFGRPGRRA